LIAFTLLALAVAGVFLVLPWLARRGDLNSFVEELVASALDVPVRVGSIESEPLGRLTLTHLRSVSAEAAGRMRFSAHEVSIHYDPVELLTGRVRKLHVRGPDLFVDLDADLTGVARMPRVPVAPQTSLASVSDVDTAASDDSAFAVDVAIVESGAATVRFDRRDLPLSDVRIELRDLDARARPSFRIEARVFESRLSVSGAVGIDRMTDGTRRYSIDGGRVVWNAVSLARWSEWIGTETAGAVDDGTVDIRGTIDGVWPERLEVTLETDATDVAVAHEAPVTVTSGAIALALQAVVEGPLDRVRFDLEADAGGHISAAENARHEKGSLRVAGVFDRTQAEAGQLRVDEGAIELVGGGRSTFSGTVRDPLAATATLEATVGLEGLLPRRALEWLPSRLLDSSAFDLRSTSGRLDGELAWRGPLRQPRVSGTLRLDAGSLSRRDAESTFEVDVRCSFDDLELDHERETITARSINVATSQVDIADALATLVGVDRETGEAATPKLRGPASLRVRVDELTLSPQRAAGRARLDWKLDGVDLDLQDDVEGLFGATGVGSVSVDWRSERDEQSFAVELEGRAKEWLLGAVYVDLADDAFAAAVEGRVRMGESGSLTVFVDDLRLDVPIGGQVEGTARLEVPIDSTPTVAVELRLPSLPTDRAFRTLIVEPLATENEFLAGAELDGRSSLLLRFEGPLSSPVFEGRLRLERARLHTSSLELRGFDLDLPLGAIADATGSSARAGRLAIAELRAGGLVAHGLDAALAVESGTYRFARPVTIRMLDGTLVVEGYEMSTADGFEIEASTHARGLSLESALRAFGVDPLPGSVDLDVRTLRYRDGGLVVGGSMDVDTLGGRITVRDLEIDDVLEPYGSLRLGETLIERLDLRRVGEAFRFGVASGVLDGRLSGLEIIGGDVTAFRLTCETIATPGVPQFVNRQAVESIRRVLSGPFGAIEETFFSRFRYAQFGFRCGLDDDGFRLRGKYIHDDIEYLMYGRWYQLPQIRIINAKPDQVYDWTNIVENIAAIYDDDAES